MNKRWLSIILVVFFIGVVSAGVALFVFPYDPINPPSVDDTGFTQEGVKEVVHANNLFSFDFYNELKDKEMYLEENLFFSPYSISTALVMTYEGAKEETAEEMKDVFYFLESNILRPNSAAIYNQINNKDNAYTLRTGNALWVQKDFELSKEYYNLVEKYYGGKAVNLDFENETEKSRLTINDFISKQTNNRIDELIKKGDLNPTTRLVLTNAIYFLGDWKYQFDKDNTVDLEFHKTLDISINVPMMYMSSKNMRDMKPDPARFNYAEFEKFQMIQLPYKDNELSMVILLPRQGEDYNYDSPDYERINYQYTLDDIDFTFEKYTEYKSLMKETNMDGIYLPKFEFKTSYNLKDILSDMGMPTAFSPSANFSGMREENDLMIDKVLHDAFIKVDEKGTEAAAATAVIMVATSAAPTKQLIFKADHPFIFLIEENSTGNILFMGRVLDPSS
jgi:serpin B